MHVFKCLQINLSRERQILGDHKVIRQPVKDIVDDFDIDDDEQNRDSWTHDERFFSTSKISYQIDDLFVIEGRHQSQDSQNDSRYHKGDEGFLLSHIFVPQVLEDPLDT